MPTPPVLSLQNVTLRYGDTVAVDALCLEVRRGEIFGLLGPNGCGKSTTLAAIAGALVPAAGVIRVAGVEERADALAYRRHVGLVPQELALYEELTAEDNLLFFGRLYGLRGRDLRRRAGQALDFVRLADRARHRVRTLSGGMQRRLNLACALLHGPPLLLLDEPTVGIDPQSREAIFASLRSLRDRGTTLVFTTHHLEEAEQLCDRVGIMDRGRLVAVRTLDETYAAPPRLERVFLELTGRAA
ncbi:MAG TPA: ABC transporter ATP-binding protein [Gemmataceae bacterium]|jgi:ABC-2 type transport system ATP-binding protein|nr:ABC transporter ATP-binding protein [Gemmataceae bacterium]